MILGGKTIIDSVRDGLITFSPFNPDMVGPNSVDITLGSLIRKVLPNCGDHINPDFDQEMQTYNISGHGGFILQPGALYLATTRETVGSEVFVPMIEGRSSIGRMGLFIHATAGFGDAGFVGQWTLELMCVYPIRVYEGMRIGQVFFHTMTDNTIQYKGRYQGQEGPTEGRFNL